MNGLNPTNSVIGMWKTWFAWRPVTLVTGETAWLRTIRRRKVDEYWEYSN